MSENDLKEVGRLVDTGRRVIHRGMEYDVLHPPSDERRADSPWVLRSRPKRGPVRYIALLRNIPNPEQLFGVNLYGKAMNVVPGWFTDRGGALKSLG